MRRVRWWLIAGGVACLAAAGLLFAGWLAVQAYGPTLTRERLEAALSEAVGGPVRIAELRLEPWRGRLVARGLTAAAAETPEAPWLRLERVAIHVGLQSLWRRELVVSRIALDGLALTLSPAGNSALPPTLLFPTQFSLGPVAVSLPRLELSRGALRYEDPAHGRRVVLEGLEGAADLAADRIDLRLQAASLHIRERGVDERLMAAEAEGRLLSDRIEIRRLEGRWRERPLRLSGELFPLRQPLALSVRLETEAELSPLLAAAGSALPVSGLAAVRGEISGDLDRPRLSGRVEAPTLTLGPVRAQAVRLEGRFADGTLALDQARGRLLGGEIRGSASFAPARPEDARVRLAFSGLDLPALDRLLPASLGATGRLAGEAELSGDPRRPESLTGPVRLTATALRLPAPADRLGVGTVTAEGRLEGGLLSLAASTARFPGVDLSARGGLTPSGPRGLSVEGALDLGHLAGLWGQGGIAGRGRFTAEASGAWERPAISGRLWAADLTVRGTRISEVDIPFRLAGSVLEGEPVLRLDRIRLAASGRLDWPSPLPSGGLDLSRDLRFRAAFAFPELSWEALTPWLPEPARGSGRLALQGTASGTLGAWQVAARLQA
ncbi:MAG: hypothetical protein WC713_14650, partial [Candidatus Methylomirabilota bacterium]